jgi:branched-chain amino acid transport system substrate-binding protein
MDKITERGFKYVFRPCNTAFDDAREQLDAVDLFSEETGRRPVTAGLLYEGTDWGRSHARNIRKLVKARGLYLVVDEGYLPDRGDFSPQLSVIRQRKPEFLIVALYTDEHILFSKQYMKSKIDIPFGIHSVGAGSEDPVFYKSVPQAAVAYMFVQEDWPLDQIHRPGHVATLNNVFMENLGYGLDAYGAQGYSNVWIIYDAVNRSGSTNREKIRDALAKTNITSGPALITGYQRISFNEKGQNVNAHGVVSQNQNGRRVTLWPRANRPSGAEPLWPIPAWSQR